MHIYKKTCTPKLKLSEATVQKICTCARESTLDQAVGVMQNNNHNIIKIIIMNIPAGTFNQATLRLGLLDYCQHVDN